MIFITSLTGMLVAGCASTTPKANNTENSDRIGALNKKVNGFRDILMDFETELKLMNSKMVSLEKRIDRTIGTGSAKAAPAGTRAEKKLAPPAHMIPAASPSTPDSGHTIKVLSGTGRLADGKALAEDLKAAGYDVKRVDVSKKRFKKDTVFYSSGLEEEAKALALIIGPETSVRTLSWNSSFDFIAVAGP